MPLFFALFLALTSPATAEDNGARRLSAAAPKQGLPAGWRVILLSGKNEPGMRRAVWWKSGDVREGSLPEALVEPGLSAENVPASSQSRVALEEALLTVDLARRLNGGNAPAYAGFLARTGKKLSCLSSHPDDAAAAWPRFKSAVAAELAFDLGDKPAGLERFKSMIFSTYDPGGALSKSTMFVPLNKAWFQTDARLKKYYADKFLGGGFDVRIEGGASGEGLSPNEKDPEDAFTAYKKTLFALRDHLATLGDAKISGSPEGKWLAGLDEGAFAGIRRMIFVHERTWERIGSVEQWAEYIPVDQSFPGLKPNYLLSVLIHEINVNSHDPFFLPSDTHLPKEDSDARRASVAAKGIAELKDPLALRAFMGLEPFLGSVYLGIYADRLAAAVPACR